MFIWQRHFVHMTKTKHFGWYNLLEACFLITRSYVLACCDSAINHCKENRRSKLLYFLARKHWTPFSMKWQWFLFFLFFSFLTNVEGFLCFFSLVILFFKKFINFIWFKIYIIFLKILLWFLPLWCSLLTTDSNAKQATEWYCKCTVCPRGRVGGC